MAKSNTAVLGAMFAALVTVAAVKGVPFIKGEEGLVLTAKPDIIGVVTYCYGETNFAELGKTYTKPECDALADQRFVEYAVAVWLALTPEAQAALTPQRLLAYTSHAYHFGKAAFARSQIAARANAGDIRGSCAHFDDWIYIKTLRGGVADRRDRTGGITAKIDGKKDCAIAENKCSGIAKRGEKEKAFCLQGVAP